MIGFHYLKAALHRCKVAFNGGGYLQGLFMFLHPSLQIGKGLGKEQLQFVKLPQGGGKVKLFWCAW